MLKMTTDKHEASRGLSATAELLVVISYTVIVIWILGIFYSSTICITKK